MEIKATFLTGDEIGDALIAGRDAMELTIEKWATIESLLDELNHQGDYADALCSQYHCDDCPADFCRSGQLYNPVLDALSAALRSVSAYLEALRNVAMTKEEREHVITSQRNTGGRPV